MLPPTSCTAGCSMQHSNTPATCMPLGGRRHAGAASSSTLPRRCQPIAATAAGAGRAGAAHQGALRARRPCNSTHKTLCTSALADGESAVLVAEAPSPEQQPGEQQQQQQCPAPDTYSLLHQLHGLCDDAEGSVAAPAQLHAWVAAAQPQLPCMSLAEVAYMASCLRHHNHLWQQLQQQQQQQQQQSSHVAGFSVSPGFLYDACAAACAVATALHRELQLMCDTQQTQDKQQQIEVAQAHPTAAADQQQQLSDGLHHILDLLQWASAEVVQQRQLLQQQLRVHQEQQSQQGIAPAAVAPLQAYRKQLQQQVEAQQQVLHLLQHPLLLQALPHANCWQLQQLLVCYGQLGQQPGFDWMGHWLAAARHAMSDLALSYQHQEWHLQHQHGPHWQQHVREHRAAAAAALAQLVGLLSGLAAAHVKPQDAWLATWEQAATTVLSAQPGFQDLEQPGSSSSGSLFNMLQQLLQSVSALGLRLSEDFWTAHEGLIQAEVLAFSPPELLRLLQLHQQVHLRPSKACIKYMTAVLEQQLTQHWGALQQQQQQQQGQRSGSVSSSAAVLQLAMCVCGLSVWGVRLHLRSVAELLGLLKAYAQQLPLPVLLQVMSILGTRMARVYSLGSSTSSSSSYSRSTSSGSMSSGSSGSYSSGSSMATLSTEEDSAAAAPCAAAAACPPVSSAVAAAAIERLLLHAAEQLAPTYTVEALSAAGDGTGSAAAGSATYAPLLRLLDVSATITRPCGRDSSAAGPAVSLTDSVTTLAAATAADGGAGSAPSAFVDRLVYKLHPMCAAAAPVCTPGQLLLMMAAWNQLGLKSGAWRFGGFRSGYRRLGQQSVVQGLSNAELAAAVEAVAKLPRTQTVVQALASEVLRRQRAPQQPQQQQQRDVQGAQQEWSGAGDDQQATGVTGAQAVQPLSAPQLLAVVCAVPGLHPTWPVDATLLLLQQVQGALPGAFNPSQQWRLWNAVQQLQQQWKPSVVAAAAAAAAATGALARTSPASSTAAAAAAAADGADPSTDTMHPSVTFAAAAAAASLKAAAAPAADVAVAASGAEGAALTRPALPSPSTSAARSSSVQGAAPAQAAPQQQQQQQLMRLLDELQHQVAAALAMVQPDPDALPLEAAPVKLQKPLQPAAAEGRPLQQRDAGKLTEQQLLAAFAKAQKSLLNPHCCGPAMVKVLEGLLLLLAVPRYAKAARKNESVRRAVLRALEASAWPDLLAQSFDIQQLLLLTAAARLLESNPEGPYMQLLGQETSRVLAEAPLTSLATGLGRIANLRLPEFKTDVTLLKFWVGRLAQAARSSPEDALALVVALTQLGFRPGAGAAGLVLQPLLAAAAATGAAAAAAAVSARRNSSDSDSERSSVLLTCSMSPASVLSLTRVLAAASLSLDADNAKPLLAAHTSLMRNFSIAQVLQLCRDVLSLELLTTAVPPTPSANPAASSREASSTPRPWLLPGADTWMVAWLRQMLKRDDTQRDSAQDVELQLLLCELDLVPWHLSSSRSAHINKHMQQLQARLAAASGWQAPLAAAVQASYHSTQELRRLVAARARRLAHEQGNSTSTSSGGLAGAAAASAGTYGSVRDAVAAAMQLDATPAAAASKAPAPSTSSSASDAYTGEAYSGTRRFVSRRAAAAAGGMQGPSSSGGFSYPSNPVQQQLQQLTHQKRVLLWAAIKHQVVRPLTAAWVESCCFNVLVGGHMVTPGVAVGLLAALAEVRRNSSSTVGSAAAATLPSAEVVLRERALTNLTGELVGRVLSSMQVLRGALFVQALAALATAGVTAARSSSGTASTTPSTSDAATAAAGPPASGAAQPFFVLSRSQQQQLFADVARVLPFLQPAQLPLLVNSMLRLQLQPDAVWLSDALQALAVKAAAAAAADQPAQQLLLLAAAKQLLVCGGVLLSASSVPQAQPDAPVLVRRVGATAAAQPSAPATLGGRSPVAFASRALAAGAAQVLGSVFRRSQQQQEGAPGTGVGAGGSSSSSGSQQPGSAMAAAAAVAAAMSDGPARGDNSVALLLSSLATQLQMAQPASMADAAAATARTQAQQESSAARAAALMRALQAQASARDEVGARPGSSEPEDAQKQQRQLLAAAVLLHAGSGAPVSLSAEACQPLRVLKHAPGAGGKWDGSWHGLRSVDMRRQEAAQQQQQRLLLGQLLQLQLQKASEQLVQAVWGSKAQQEAPEQEQAASAGSAADVCAAQVLLDPTGDLLGAGQAGRPSAQQQQQPPMRPHRLVTQGLQVQFDGLLRKAFMAAAAAAAGSRGAPPGVQPWWLPKAPRDVSGLLQAPAPEGSGVKGGGSGCGTDGLGGPGPAQRLGAGSVGAGAASSGGVTVEGGVVPLAAGVGEGGPAGAEPVLVLPVMSRALDAQFARLMREVLHSSLSTGGGSGAGGS